MPTQEELERIHALSGKKKKKRSKTAIELGIPDDFLDFLGDMAMGGAAEKRVSPAMEQSLQHRFDTQFAGTRAALAVGPSGALENTGDARATPASKPPVPEVGGLAEAIPLLGEENMARMGPDDIVTLSGWLANAKAKKESVQSAVDAFKANKGWLK
jgi:hypothetical protein